MCPSVITFLNMVIKPVVSKVGSTFFLNMQMILWDKRKRVWNFYLCLFHLLNSSEVLCVSFIIQIAEPLSTCFMHICVCMCVCLYTHRCVQITEVYMMGVIKKLYRYKCTTSNYGSQGFNQWLWHIRHHPACIPLFCPLVYIFKIHFSLLLSNDMAIHRFRKHHIFC